MKRLQEVRRICADHHIDIIPSFLSAAYGGAVLAHDKNLAAGLPVKDALFVVIGPEARLAQEPKTELANGGFEQQEGDAIPGFQTRGQLGDVIAVDRQVFKGGKASLRFSNFERVPDKTAGISQDIAVHPHRCYRLRCWVRSENLNPSDPFGSGNFSLEVTGVSDGRRLQYLNPSMKPTGDWHEVAVGFNSWGYDKVRIAPTVEGSRNGKFWIDDLRLEEVGLLNLLRRPGTPVSVRGEKNGIVYEETRDYDPLADPGLDFRFDHDGPPIRLTASSRIRDGERLRVPAEGEIGYLPSDGSTVRTNPPALAWLPERGADAFTVQLARDRGFTSSVITVRRTPYVLYTHTATLAPGAWWWRYACLDGRGNRSPWSHVRRFIVAPDAEPFPKPDEEWVQQHLPERHPRLMIRPEEVPMFRQARFGSRKARWDELVKNAEDYLKAPLIPEPPPWTGGTWNAAEWRRNYASATKASQISETLAFCFLLSGDRRYGEGARKWLLHIASWNPAGSTSMDVNDEAGMPILHVASRAYDWAYDALSEEDRTTLRKIFRVRGEEAYNWLHDQPYEQKAYNSHGGRMWHFLGESAIAYYEEVPEAGKWLDYALTIFWGWYPSYGDEDGGWAQGYAYWASYVNRSTWWLDALRAGLGVDGTKKPFYRNVGLFPLYVAPPNGALVGFGDFAEAAPGPAAAVPVSYFARMRGVPEWQWFAETWGKGEGERGPIGFIRDARPDPPKVKPQAPAGWPQAKWFRGAGWVALHSSLMNPAENVQLMMRAAPLGNISHSHADQNAIVLGAFGSPLLVNTGIQPWYGSPFCTEWYWTTKAHNALEIDGQGQPKNGAATGKFIVFRPGKEVDYVVGEATPGYGGKVERYRRHLVFLKPDVVVVVDEIRAPKPVSLRFWLHGLAPFEIDPPAGRIALTFDKASLIGFLCAPGGLSIVQTDKYPIPPESGTTRPEWHLSAETSQAQSEARIIAVFGIGKPGETIALDSVEDVSAGRNIAIRLQRAGKPVAVSIDTSIPALVVR